MIGGFVLALELTLCVLQGVQLMVTALLMEQLLMRSLLNDLALRKQDDVVGVLDGGKPVGDHQHSADVLHFFQGVLNEHFRFGIDVGSGFVQDHHAGLMDNGTGKAEQLPLTGREVVAPFPDRLVQALFQAVNEVVSIYILAGGHHFFIGNIVFLQKDVAADGAGEEEHILQHLAEMTAQRGDLDLLDVDAVDQDLTLLDVVVPADQGKNGGLAGAGGADEGNGLPGRYLEGNALQHPLTGLVGKPNILKFNITFQFFQFNGIRLVHDLRDHIHNGEDLFRGSEGRLQGVELLGKGLYGIKEAGGEHIEGNDCAAGDDLTQNGGILDVTPAAQIQQAQHTADVEQVDHRTENTEDHHSLLLGFLDSVALFQEVLHFLLLPVEDLGDLDAGKVFRKEGVHICAAVGYRSVGFAGEFLEHIGEKHHKGNEAQHDQGHCVVDEQHHHYNADDHHGVLYQSDQHIGEHHGNGIGVVGDPGHQLAHGDIVQLLVGKTFNVRKYIFTEGREDLLTDLLQHHRLNIHADHRNDQDAGIQGHHTEKRIQGEAILLHQFLDIAYQHGGDQVINDGNEHYGENHHKLLFMGFGIVQKATDDLAVRNGTLPGPIVFLFLHQQVCDQKNNGRKTNDGAHDQNRQVLTHSARLLPLQAAAGLPWFGRQGRWHTDLRACRRPPACRRR